MNPSIIQREYPPNDPEAAYLVEVARRIEQLLVARKGSIDAVFASALAPMLTVTTVRFRDGFVANPIDDFQKIIGNVEALMIVEALAPDLPPKWRDAWRTDPKGQARCFEELRELFQGHPEIESID